MKSLPMAEIPALQSLHLLGGKGKRGRYCSVENPDLSIDSDIVTQRTKSEFPIAAVCRVCGE
jgi:hypothetical protein